MQTKNVKILLFSANPEGTSKLKLDQEVSEIKQRIRASEHHDRIDVEIMGAVRPADLLEAMNLYQPHVVQFSGHANRGEGILVCDELGNAKVIDGDALTALFRVTGKNVQVVVLNACYSQPQAEAISQVVPCVVGMKDTIGDSAARFFAASFYSALGYGHSVATAFEQGLVRLKLEGSKLGNVPQSEIPILLTRSDVNASEIFPVSSPLNITTSQPKPTGKRTKIFISYSHKDVKWLNRLQVHLKPLERSNEITRWDDTLIKPGDKWRQAIKSGLEEAKVAVLLISADFLASDFINSNELPPLLSAAESEGVVILPIVLSPSRFVETKGLSQFQSVNPPSKPLNTMTKAKQEEVFLKASQVIEDALRS